ncbi:hypothetical protein JYB87_03330 [Shewanella avicenniae]|uniref:Uncharacterized protein n=1 Tax=Shewanella avicenniae TaxID=2814294 RepID=A0ABX7QUI4_9GAMM|nr:hypothetical protein [Shewanella avicenniae]QSX34298.1 hypothetical protein JYB87_03330 [Shewanella avicenniae]
MNNSNKNPVPNWLMANLLHFVLTTLTFGLWAPVWWWFVFREEIKTSGWFHLFDNDYWDYIVERDEPPAALYPTRFDLAGEMQFKA